MNITLRKIAIVQLHTIMVFGVSIGAVAQSVPPAGVSIPSNAPERIEQITPKPSDTPQLPTSPPPTAPPTLEAPTLSQPSPGGNSDSGERFQVNKIEVLGSTVLRREIAHLIQAYEHRQLTFEDLVELRSAITRLYIDHGYITSGAFIPNNQLLDSGIVQIQVVEGELEHIEISGLKHLQESYIRRRLEQAATIPLNRQRVEEALQLLQLNPLISRVNAELTAGSTPGQNVLRVSLQEAPAIHAGMAINNAQVPSVGSIQGTIFASNDNVLGWGDRLAVEYGRSEGLNQLDFSYALPLNPQDGTLSLRYDRNNSKIIEDIFRDLDIRSQTRTFSIGFRQPIVRSPRQEFALGLSLDLRRNQTFLLNDIPFSFSEGADNGKSQVTVLRFTQDWVTRSPTRVLAARSQFSIGLNAFGATINDTRPNGRFFSWLGQFQWVQQLSARTLLLTRLAAQFTPNSLLSLERFSLGGIDTIRGYRQNQLVADNGVLSSLEVRIPLTADPQTLQLAPFFDIGTGWNYHGANPAPHWIAGLGLGLEWHPGPNIDIRLDYGIPPA